MFRFPAQLHFHGVAEIQGATEKTAFFEKIHFLPATCHRIPREGGIFRDLKMASRGKKGETPIQRKSAEHRRKMAFQGVLEGAREAFTFLHIALRRNRFYTDSDEPMQKSGETANFRKGIAFFHPTQLRISAQDAIEPVGGGEVWRG